MALDAQHENNLSLPTRGAWIEITLIYILELTEKMSLPTRGAWIEMLVLVIGLIVLLSLPTRGAWIEITHLHPYKTRVICRSPRGERGLKSKLHKPNGNSYSSLPTRGAWIEMRGVGSSLELSAVAPHAGSVD